MFYILVGLCTLMFSYGLMRFLMKPFEGMAVSAVKQFDILIVDSMDEDLKDSLLLKNVKTLMFRLLKVLGIIIAICIVSSLPLFIYWEYFKNSDMEVNGYFAGLAMIVGGGLVLFFVGRKEEGDYTYWTKMIHAIILDNYNIGKALFKREVKNLSVRTSDVSKEKFVIISGLARGGTTALTNLLYDPKHFHSISYANMPFLLGPNLWSKIYTPKSDEVKERAHGDKMLVGEKSIEALEEYFFKVFLNDRYIDSQSLRIHEVEVDVFRDYLDYQKLFIGDNDKSVYIAKNNNFVLRYKALRKMNDSFKLVLIMRDPLSHANSLRIQHSNFNERQDKDSFVLDYMNWIGHYEFGKNIKYFDLGFEKSWEKYEDKSLNYWLSIWVNYYSFVLRIVEDQNLFLIKYEDLLSRPEALKLKLGNLLDMNFDIQKIEKFEPREKSISTKHVDNDVLKSAEDLYGRLL